MRVTGLLIAIALLVICGGSMTGCASSLDNSSDMRSFSEDDFVRQPGRVVDSALPDSNGSRTRVPDTVGEQQALVGFNTRVTVTGYVVSGGEVKSKGLKDTQARFIYTIQSKDGSMIDVTFDDFPSTTDGDLENEKINLNIMGGHISPGDNIEACGTYDRITRVLIVANKGDYITTSAAKK